MVWADIVTREAAVEYFHGLFRGGLEREFSNAWNALASCAVDLYPDELFPDIRQAFEEGLIDPAYIEFSDVEDALCRPKDPYLRDKRARSHGLVGDVVNELEGWACFRDRSEPLPEPEHKSFVPSPAKRPAQAGRTMSLRQRQEIQEMLRQVEMRQGENGNARGPKVT